MLILFLINYFFYQTNEEYFHILLFKYLFDFFKGFFNLYFKSCEKMYEKCYIPVAKMIPNRTPKKKMEIMSLHEVIAMITVWIPLFMPKRSSCSFNSTVITENVSTFLLPIICSIQIYFSCLLTNIWWNSGYHQTKVKKNYFKKMFVKISLDYLFYIKFIFCEK